jgi:hypothetical protein
MLSARASLSTVESSGSHDAVSGTSAVVAGVAVALGAELAPLSSARAKLLPRPMRSLKALSSEDAYDTIGVVGGAFSSA